MRGPTTSAVKPSGKMLAMMGFCDDDVWIIVWSWGLMGGESGDNAGRDRCSAYLREVTKPCGPTF